MRATHLNSFVSASREKWANEIKNISFKNFTKYFPNKFWRQKNYSSKTAATSLARSNYASCAASTACVVNFSWSRYQHKARQRCCLPIADLVCIDCPRTPLTQTPVWARVLSSLTARLRRSKHLSRNLSHCLRNVRLPLQKKPDLRQCGTAFL